MRTSTAICLHLPHEPAPKHLRLVAIALIAIPAVILLLLAIGETVGGEPSGVQHIPEALVLLVLMVASWRHSRGVGIALLSIGSLLFVGWLLFIVAQAEPRVGSILPWAAAGLLLFVPPLVAGWLLIRASR